MSHATLEMNGKRFVLVPEKEYRRLVKPSVLPPLPAKDARGNFPAALAATVVMARTIIQRREAVGMSQKELAEMAGIRPETLNRLEKAKVTPDTSTLTKIDRALVRAERRN